MRGRGAAQAPLFFPLPGSAGSAASGIFPSLPLTSHSIRISSGEAMALTQTDPSLYNPDLAPIPMEKRSWGTYNYASLWVAMSV